MLILNLWLRLLRMEASKWLLLMTLLTWLPSEALALVLAPLMWVLPPHCLTNLKATLLLLLLWLRLLLLLMKSLPTLVLALLLESSTMVVLIVATLLVLLMMEAPMWLLILSSLSWVPSEALALVLVSSM